MTRTEARKLVAQIEAMIAKAGIKGFELSTDGCRYGQGEATIKLKAVKAGAVTREQSLLKAWMKENGIKKTKNANGDELVAYNSRAKKYPVEYTRASDGKRFKCDAQSAKYRFK